MTTATMNTNNDNSNDNRASALITELLSITPTTYDLPLETVAGELGVRNRQLDIVTELLDLVDDSAGPGEGGTNTTTGEGEEDGGGRRSSASFIRTNIHSDGQQPSVHLRDILGSLPSSTVSDLASSLSRLISHRVDIESLLPGTTTQDADANLDAMGTMATPSGRGDGNGGGEGSVGMLLRSGESTAQSCAKAALTISPLGLKAAQLYVALIKTRGAWGAGLIDVGGMSAVTSLIRRWCVECRGRESVLSDKATGKGGKKKKGDKPPPAKRSKPSMNDKKKKVAAASRKSVRVSEVVSVMNHDDGDDVMSEEEDVEEGTTFQVMEEEVADDSNTTPSQFLTEYGMITGGLSLATALGSIPHLNHAEYNNWSSESREYYLEGTSAALGIASALLAGCQRGKKKKGSDGDTAVLCQGAVESLDNALRMTALPPKKATNSAGDDGTLTAVPLRRRSGKSRNSRRSLKEDAAAKKRLQESGIYLLRGLLPLFNLKMELPNGQAGKLAAYETASNLLVNIISSISEDIELNGSSKSPRDSVATMLDDSITPKRGGRKSVGFSHTPRHAAGGKRRSSIGTTPNDSLLMAPPSLKKSITPRRTRSSSSSGGSSAFSDRPGLHPMLSLITGMLHRLFTSKGLERAESRSRICSLGLQCLSSLPTNERSNLLRFIGDMCESKISSHRLLGVEIIGEVLCQSWFWKDHEKSEQVASWMYTPFSNFGERASQMEDINGGAANGSGSGAGGESPSGNNSTPTSMAATPSSILLGALQGRLTDKSPTVRVRAAMSLSEIVKKASIAQEENRNLDGTIIAEKTPISKKKDGSATDEGNNIPSRALTVSLCKMGKSLVDALRRRASTDDKATVRKASIIAWLSMLNLAHRENADDFLVSGLDISALCQLCNDTSVATRKAAADALTKLVMANYDKVLNTPQASSLEMAWAHTVLPLVTDAEATCVTKAVEFFNELVIEPIVELGSDTTEKLKDDESNTRYFVAWRILSKVSNGCQEAGGSRTSGSLTTALQKLLINAGKDSKSLAKNLIRAVYHVGAISLGLDRRTSLDSTMSHDSKLEEDLFDINTSSMRTGAWCLLDALTSCLTSNSNISLSQAVRASQIDSSFLALSLKKLRELMNSPDVPSDKKGSLTSTSRDCLRVITKMGSFVPFDDAETCFLDLLKDLESFNVSIDLVSAAISALIALTKRMCDDDDSGGGKDVFREVEVWAKVLLSRCEGAIESCIASLAQRGMFNGDDEKLLCHVLYLLSEVSMIGFSSQEDSSRLTTKQKKDDITPTDTEPVRGLLNPPSARLVHLVKLILPNSMPLPSAAASEHEEESMISTPTGMRAHAFIALGKLCLRDESLAKESLNILARELHRDARSDPSVMSNCLMVMGDLCVRYTNLVDKYLMAMAACLQAGDGNLAEVNASSRLSLSFGRNTNGYSLVKKNAILLLTSLLLQDYVKWRGLFIHRFLAAVADPDDEVSCLATTALRGPLLEKQPNLLCSSFVGSVFVFNACKAHPLYAAESSSGGNGLTVDFECAPLVGSEGYHQRREIYKMMLSNMTDVQKLEVTARLVKEILGGALEVSGDLSAVCKLSSSGESKRTKLSSNRIDAATNVLTDALAILTSPEIKVGRKGGDDAEDDLLASANGSKPDQRIVHKQRLLSKMSRKHLVENVIPIVCNLKTVLEGSHSPLIKNLMQYLGFIFRSYKTEVQEHLANNPTLLQELEYDLRQYEKQQRKIERESLRLQAEISFDG